MENQLMDIWKMGDLTDQNRVLNTNKWCCIRANVDFASKTGDFPSEQRRVSAAFFFGTCLGIFWWNSLCASHIISDCLRPSSILGSNFKVDFFHVLADLRNTDPQVGCVIGFVSLFA